MKSTSRRGRNYLGSMHGVQDAGAQNEAPKVVFYDPKPGRCRRREPRSHDGIEPKNTLGALTEQLPAALLRELLPTRALVGAFGGVSVYVRATEDGPRIEVDTTAVPASSRRLFVAAARTALELGALSAAQRVTLRAVLTALGVSP